MTKKFVALTMVLVLAAGFMAVAADDSSDTLTGKWETNLYFMPGNWYIWNDSSMWMSSELNATYTTGGISFKSNSVFEYKDFLEQEFALSTSMGLLDISSTANFEPRASYGGPGLDYWGTDVSLTLGGVTISDYFLLQNTSNNVKVNDGFGAGNKITFSGETPGGISVTVDNYLGMEPVTDGVGDFTGFSYGSYWVGYNPHGDYAYGSGYAIVTAHSSTQTGSYSPSSMQYVGTTLSLENLSLGCCDFSNTTTFSEANGFVSSLFEFSVETNNLPLSFEVDLEFTSQTKSVSITPSISTDWACFDVYTQMNGNYFYEGNVFDSLDIVGFAIKDVELGDVKVSSWTALGDNTLSADAMDAPLPLEPWGPDNTDTYQYTGYDELLKIEKLDKYDLDFALSTYFNMGNGGLFDLGLFQVEASYALSDQFTFGSRVWVRPQYGLDVASLDFTYSW